LRLHLGQETEGQKDIEICLALDGSLKPQLQEKIYLVTGSSTRPLKAPLIK
jgi:hypothetical protein